MIVPYGSMPGFSLNGDRREVEAYYGLPRDTLRTSDGRKSEMIAQARHALFWKLARKRKLSPARIAHLLRCSKSAVREGIALHEQRIAEFRATSGKIGT